MITLDHVKTADEQVYEMVDADARESIEAVEESLAGKLDTDSFNVLAGTVETSLENMQEQLDSIVISSGVASFNGRTGLVTAESGDYTAAQITTADGSNVESELSALEAADTAAAEALAAETARAKDVEGNLSSLITTGYTSDLVTAINATYANLAQGAWPEINSLKTSVSGLSGTVEANKTSVDEDLNTIGEDLTALTSKVTTLIGSDSGKSARTVAVEELAAQLIPDNAKESLDTLQEIAAWIQSHPDDASAMNTKIGTLETNLADEIARATAKESAIESDIGAADNKYSSQINALAAALGYNTDEWKALLTSTDTSDLAKALIVMLGNVVSTGETVASLQSSAPVRLASQNLTASGGSLTFTNSAINDDSLIDVYASIPNIAPSDITQSGTSVTVTFDAQDSAFDVAIVVQN